MLYATIMLDRERKVKYPVRRQIQLESMFNKRFFELLPMLATGKIDEIMKVLFIGLLYEDPNLTYEQMLDIIDNSDVSDTEILNAISIGVGYSLWGKTMDQKMDETEEKIESGEIKPEEIIPNAMGLTGTNT